MNKFIRTPLHLLAAALATSLLALAEPREWTASDGRKLTAEVIAVKNGRVTLKRSPDNRVFEVPLDSLDTEGKEFLSSWKGTALRSLTISVKAEMVQHDSKDTRWETDYGSYDKKGVFSRGLSVTAKTSDASANPDTVIKYAFTGIDQATMSPVIYDSGQAPFKVMPGFGYTEVFFSEVKTNSDTNYAALGERYREGVKPSGWALIIEQDGREVFATGSTPETLKNVRLMIINDNVKFPIKKKGKETTGKRI
jgi:hypothetical protein